MGMTANFSSFLQDHMVYAGPHPSYEDPWWWQIAFDFGKIQVSIASTPYTDGVELKVVADYERQLVLQKRTTIKQTVDVLAAILIWRGEL
jgi:hypothetical protein